jgi:hypothetical protein
MTLDTLTVEILLFSSRDVTVIIEWQDKILIIRVILLLTPSEELVIRTMPSPLEDSLPVPWKEENPFVLPASTAPALLQMNAQPKRARGLTLDYKAMHEGKQNQPK